MPSSTVESPITTILQLKAIPILGRFEILWPDKADNSIPEGRPLAVQFVMRSNNYSPMNMQGNNLLPLDHGPERRLIRTVEIA